MPPRGSGLRLASHHRPGHTRLPAPSCGGGALYSHGLLHASLGRRSVRAFAPPARLSRARARRGPPLRGEHAGVFVIDGSRGALASLHWWVAEAAGP
uniref:Uncharacterized protein n=1 Tax=Setaria viridis TaxID=4556 RepID=A0A4U6T1N6_SETVI|nr:hypothetical protein SEVIR_9G365650v2 [Setaria viridis]